MKDLQGLYTKYYKILLTEMKDKKIEIYSMFKD